MNDRNIEIQDQILAKALEDATFDGWSWSVVENAAVKAGYSSDMAIAVFPRQIADVMCHFSQWADRQMMAQLEEMDSAELRVRDRIQQGVKARIEVLTSHKEAVRSMSGFWFHPFRKIEASKLVWKTADKIWLWAGDEAKDYNYYTKRALLAGVITATMIAWLNDTSDNNQQTIAFLNRRINNVLSVGKFIGGIKKRTKHV